MSALGKTSFTKCGTNEDFLFIDDIQHQMIRDKKYGVEQSVGKHVPHVHGPWRDKGQHERDEQC